MLRGQGCSLKVSTATKLLISRGLSMTGMEKSNSSHRCK